VNIVTGLSIYRKGRIMTVKEIVEMLLDGDVKATDSLFIRVFNEEGNFFELKAVDSIGTMTNNGLDIFVK
jgi:hypothetical protein